ncbi:MAG: peptidase family protein [Ilumatobacteraceae bacterium]|nr:peptidase family protein [Ilumatobacteraceae bacterium]MCU1386835.1 peptidase family protein [Ilumatobacteraceae bacterium]
MITLGIETATQVVSVAVGGDDGVLGMVEIAQGRRHAETLAPAIEFVCRHAQVAIGEIAAIGVDVGPGLFTGMRVGIASAKAMAHALQVPVVGVSSLDLLAHPLRHTSKVIAGVIDARKGEVFYAFFLPTPGGVQRVTEPRVGSIEDFNADVMARGQDVLAVGDGACRYRDELDIGVEVADLAHPSVASLVTLARARVLRSDLEALRADDVQPMYLRAPDAQINWSVR